MALVLYRGHTIVLLADVNLSAEISVMATADPLPTKVFATLEEGEAVCIKRAKRLVELYLQDRPR